MTDSTGAPTGPDPDFLDRLLARHRPAAPARPGVVRLQPRLTGPFERVEAVGGPDTVTGETAPLWPTAPQQDATERQLPGVREVLHRTERERTVVRTEHPAEPEPPGPRPAPTPPPGPPLLRPVTTTAPRLRPLPERPRRGDAGDPAAAQPGPRTAVHAPAAHLTPVPAPPTPLRPNPADTAAARAAARQSGARRQTQPAEQVVRVQIGRLEVTSAGPTGTGPAAGRPGARDRREATVSLADYLARGRE